ncbi:unnamed protein product [Nezara viridula]|uniref:Uncharacterized protein n=1 Tax=Nezara viridula TaxID=85310 RepID=A0A9P0HLG9_NEZVI|nr:unnamed protein product [Nezara viridula]
MAGMNAICDSVDDTILPSVIILKYAERKLHGDLTKYEDLKNGETSNCLVIADDPAGDDTPIYECQLEPLDLTMMSELNNSLKQLGIKRPADFIGNDKIKQRRVNSDLRVKADNLRRAKQDEPRQRKVKEWWKT